MTPLLPKKNHYDYALLLGSFLPAVKDRLDFLIESWNQGITFDSMAVLAGNRILRKAPGEPDYLADIEGIPYEIEYDMAKRLVETTPLPLTLQSHLEGKIIFVNALGKDGLHSGTHENLETWIHTYTPAVGSILAPSSPVVIHYQELAAKNSLGSGYSLEMVASSGNPSQCKVSVVLDTLAKCLYEIRGMPL